MARWEKGRRTVQYLVDRGRLENVEAEGLDALADALLARATLRVDTTAVAALTGGDIDGAYVAAYDAYRMAAESLLARQGLRATGGDGSHMTVRPDASWAIEKATTALSGARALLADSPPDQFVTDPAGRA